MNFALPTLAVFALLLPGFIARSRIKRIERQSLDYSPFGQIVSEALLWALALHLLWCGLAWLMTAYEPRPEVLLRLLGSDNARQAQSVEAIAAMAGPITVYIGSLLLFAYLMPTALRRLISHWRLDSQHSRLSPWLRFSGAPWYYLLTGADFPRDEAPDLIAVSAIVNVAGEGYLYTGLLSDYFLDTEGKLDRLVLRAVMRRPLAADKPDPAGEGGNPLRFTDRFYVVDGDYFVLRYSELITLNVEYIKLAEQAA
ncbi:hypothetical protein H5407_20930 [Mitsuaria sp. WAJ17]|uniref:hypothetical protein n=1 Tax=Mitsuaria sp. WAJ17 TaxID=2761452 RepID=UPI001600A5AD|nr:hypothetical protein [Mitsuaria sp. WAJ17]MBB2487709.1 hypothetical protein [Mitsuaria sp. WAJ17]